ncbi:hypothetical protein GCM10011611_43860 [Aliidongia dinghuensis]|uniref:Serine dehydrogenasease n=1 Tax=Aliidongia dinghuensis TaxID=1867774 RepID=A0A8J2YYF1_9PROT|nr:ATP-dependent Clp protease proteolytic subunit [Aliidongia dinghuensis]GGF32901.1 hypothetical protein GCM10011611_43860 [Aliidongia dinghuensis]
MPDSKLDDVIVRKIDEAAKRLEKKFSANVMFYMGTIHPAFIKSIRDFIEELASHRRRKDTLVIMLNTLGGSAQAVEKMVEIIRYHYKTVYFVVPDMAMSAGTILCMAGDKIFMDYSSSLGPIDPQVIVTGSNGSEQYIPALGFLDKVEELIGKSKDGTITPAEFAILKDQNLALLRSYEQARDLSVELLKKWLVAYKFQNWTNHRTDPTKKGQPVTQLEKEQRAKEIADKLGSNKIWHSHGRFIGIGTLQSILRLEIDDYTKDISLRTLIRVYSELITDYMDRQGVGFVLHSPHIPLV